jgi:hypothetical protein
MRRLLLPLGAFALALQLGSCAKADPYADIEGALSGMIAAKTRFAAEAASAETPEAMAEALTAFAERASLVSPRWEAALKKHPEIRWDEPPASIAPLMERYIAVLGKHDEAAAKVEGFIDLHPGNEGLRIAYERFLAAERYHER